MMESLIEFKSRVKKATGSHIHKIRNSLGVYDCFKDYRKNRPGDRKYVLSESQYFSIIRQMNNLLCEEIAKGNEVVLPYRMGTIEVRKFERSVRIGEDGKVITNLPIDWDGTLRLWYEDEESYRNRTLLRINEPEIYKIVWNKENVNFNNRSFFEFRFNRDLRRRLKCNIREGIVDDALHIGHIKGKRKNVV